MAVMTEEVALLKEEGSAKPSAHKTKRDSRSQTRAPSGENRDRWVSALGLLIQWGTLCWRGDMCGGHWAGGCRNPPCCTGGCL